MRNPNRCPESGRDLQEIPEMVDIHDPQGEYGSYAPKGISLVCSCGRKVGVRAVASRALRENGEEAQMVIKTHEKPKRPIQDGETLAAMENWNSSTWSDDWDD